MKLNWDNFGDVATLIIACLCMMAALAQCCK